MKNEKPEETGKKKMPNGGRVLQIGKEYDCRTDLKFETSTSGVRNALRVPPQASDEVLVVAPGLGLVAAGLPGLALRDEALLPHELVHVVLLPHLHQEGEAREHVPDLGVPAPVARQRLLLLRCLQKHDDF